MTTTRGMLTIMSAPSPLCPHVEWALGGVLGMPISLDWRPQPAERGSYRSEFSWTGAPGMTARIVSALKRWPRLRFEASDAGSATAEPERYSYTPTLGVFHAMTTLNGDVVIPEDQLRGAMLSARGDAEALQEELEALLGSAWDEELNVFRQAGEGESLRWLHEVG